MRQTISTNEAISIVVGEPITLTTVLAVCAIAIIAVVAYKMFLSSEGSTTLPGGWKFTWD